MKSQQTEKHFPPNLSSQVFPSRVHCCCSQVSAMTLHPAAGPQSGVCDGPQLRAALFQRAKHQGLLHRCSHLSVVPPTLHVLSFLRFKDTVVHLSQNLTFSPLCSFSIISSCSAFTGYWGWRKDGKRLIHHTPACLTAARE